MAANMVAMGAYWAAATLHLGHMQRVSGLTATMAACCQSATWLGVDRALTGCRAVLLV